MTTSTATLGDPALLRLLERAGVRVEDGVQLVALDRLAARPVDAGMALVVLPPAAEAAAVAGTADHGPLGAEAPALAGRHGHGHDPLALLRRLYPASHRVHHEGGETTVGALDAAAAVSGPFVLPALDALSNTASPFGLAWLVARLRAPDGCPWDREQDHLSLRSFLLEETYEVYDALEAGSTPALAEELGDLLLQIVLHAQYGAEAGVFDLADVQQAVMTKIVRRHPHVFGDVEAATASDVLRNWEQLKAAERADADARAEAAVAAGQAGVAEGAGLDGRGRADDAMPGAFAGLSRSLPALAYADEMQGRAASLGYDWPDLEGVIDKIAEEASELLAADDDAARHEEFGDLLFVIVNMGRKLGIDPEASLRAASRKFAARFARVERLASEQGVELRTLGLDALDDLWQLAKREEASRHLDRSGEETA